MRTPGSVLVLTILSYFAVLSVGCVNPQPSDPLQSLTILGAPQSPIRIGSAIQLTATGTLESGNDEDETQTVDWSSSDPTVATVNSDTSPGMVQAIAFGTVTITATDPDTGISAAATVNVATNGTGLTITPSVSGITAGNVELLKATVMGPNGQMVDVTQQATWVSSNTAAITFSTLPGSGGVAIATTTPIPNGDVPVQVSATYEGATATATVIKDDGCGVLGATTFSGGSGTAADPYLLCSPQDIAAMAARYVTAGDSAYFSLVRDIDFGGATIAPIPWFNGTLDGGGYGLSNFTVSPGSNAGGLILVSNGGTIRNLVLTDATVTGVNFVGGIIGEAVGQVTIDHVITYSGSVSASGHFMGGLIGLVDSSSSAKINQCYVTGSVTGGIATTGGFVGQVEETGSLDIEDSYITAQVTGGSAADFTTGGMIGACLGTCTLERDYVDGPVSGNGTIGAIFGANGGGLVANSVYWDEEATGLLVEGAQGPAGGSTGELDAQMRIQATFVGWDFTNVWQMTDGASPPVLQWVWNQ